MVLLELILVLFLQFEGVRGGRVFVYYRPGSDAILPCNSVSSSAPTCSNINWLYNRVPSKTILEVKRGTVQKNSARAARLILTSNCSLIINNITAEDVGRYTCRPGQNTDLDKSVYLNILTISPSPPDADPNRDGHVTLQCSLLRYIELNSCQPNSIRWVDEAGALLDDEGVGYELSRQMNCDSSLTVKRQSGHNRRYTCQYVEGGSVKIEAHYTPVFTDPSDPNKTIIIVGVVVGVVVVLLVIVAFLLKYRRRAKVQKDQINGTIPDVQKSTYPSDDPEGCLTYVTVDHSNQKAATRKKAIEENVTYSAVKSPVRKAEDDANSLYCSIDKAH